MKKILLFSFLLCIGSSVSYGQTTVTKKINPDTGFLGMTKSTNTYEKQSNTFFVGYNDFNKNPSNTYGRGYLTFDLKDIPSDATINSASLQLNSIISFDSNFQGKIRIMQSALFAYPDAVVWTQLVGGPVLATVDYTREGVGMSIAGNGGNAIKTLVNEYKGRKVFLSIQNLDESKVIRFSGKSDELYLNVSYTTNGSGSGGGGTTTPPEDIEVLSISGPSTLSQYSKSITYSASEKPTMGYWAKWTVNSDYIKIISGWGTSKIVIDAIPKMTPGIEYTTIYYELINTKPERKVAQGEIIVEIKPYEEIALVPVSGTIACDGSLISYSIKGLPEDVSINWSAGNQLSLVSGQAGSTAMFKNIGAPELIFGPYGWIRAELKYYGTSTILEENKILIGRPRIETLEVPSNGVANNIYMFKCKTYNSQWNLVDWTVSPSTGINMHELYGGLLEIVFTQNGTYTITASAGNDCGVDTKETTIRITGGSTGGLIGGGDNGKPVISLPNLHSLLIDETGTLSFVNLKIYTLTGSLVYTEKEASSDFDIRNTHLADGIYIVEKQAGENLSREKIILRR